MTEVDWAVELRKIERQFEGLPPEPEPVPAAPVGVARTPRAAQAGTLRADSDSSGALGTWLRLALVAALAGALAAWPYQRDCGTGLFAYLGAQSVVALGGLWVSTCTWRHRMPRTHAIALAIALTGIALVAGEVLPRTGYAITTGPMPGWSCE